MSISVLYFGMLGEYSRIPLMALLAAEIEVCGVVIPASGGQNAQGKGLEPILLRAPGNKAAVANPSASTNIAGVARAHHIPVFELYRANDSISLQVLQALQADIGCVACFSQILPTELLALPRLGFVNLHPSLLPEYRGPVPLFWLFRHGKHETGATVHFMEERVDRGDILQQSIVHLPDGISGLGAERLCALAGASLLVDSVRQLQQGNSKRQPQRTDGSYYPMPTADDFRIPLSWSARHAFNFIRGTTEWQRPYPVTIGGEELLLTKAISYLDDGQLGQVMARDGRQVWLQFRPGVLQAVTLF